MSKIIKKIQNRLENHEAIIVAINNIPVMMTRRSGQTLITSIRQSQWLTPQIQIKDFEREEFYFFNQIRKLTKDEIIDLTKDAIMDWLPIRNYGQRTQNKIRTCIAEMGVEKMIFK